MSSEVKVTGTEKQNCTHTPYTTAEYVQIEVVYEIFWCKTVWVFLCFVSVLLLLLYFVSHWPKCETKSFLLFPIFLTLFFG